MDSIGNCLSGQLTKECALLLQAPNLFISRLEHSIWRRENENENSDSRVRLMRDQIIMGRIYSVLAKSRNKLDLYQELLSRIKESQHVVGEANADADLHHR